MLLEDQVGTGMAEGPSRRAGPQVVRLDHSRVDGQGAAGDNQGEDWQGDRSLDKAKQPSRATTNRVRRGDKGRVDRGVWGGT